MGDSGEFDHLPFSTFYLFVSLSLSAFLSPKGFGSDGGAGALRRFTVFVERFHRLRLSAHQRSRRENCLVKIYRQVRSGTAFDSFHTERRIRL